MTEQATSTIQGSQLWLPSDSFHRNYNVIGLQEMLSGFETVNFIRQDSDDSIYCTGNNRIIYHTVDGSNVGSRLIQLEKSPSPITAALQPDQVVEPKELAEEARLRELHLGIGRTSLFLAIHADQSSDFLAASHDLQRAFSAVTQPIHTVKELEHTAIRREGLIYMFVQAARKHKALSPEAAKQLAEALNQGLLPLRGDSKKTDKTETWLESRGKGFIERIGFTQKQPVYPKQARVAREREARRAAKKPYTVNVEPIRVRQPGVQKARAGIFIARLLKDQRGLSYSEKLALAHSKYTGKEAEAFEINDNIKLELGKLGVEAYLEAMSKRDGDPASQMMHYITRRRSMYQFGLLPLLIASNLAAAKVNARGGIRGRQIKLPGLSAPGLPTGFRAIRHLFYNGKRGKLAAESPENKKLGDVVEAYLKAAFTESDDQSYEISDAPEGVAHANDFAIANGISRSTLDNVIGEYGLDAKSYKFGHRIGKGLSPTEQEFVTSMLDEIRVEDAPQGYRSVSSFANIHGVTKPRVEKLAQEQGLSIGRHRFGSTPGASLSPEAQKKLKEILDCRPRRQSAPPQTTPKPAAEIPPKP